MSVDLSLRELLSLEGRVAIVTGAAQGFGFAIARRLAEAGASVAVAEINARGGEEAAARIRKEHKASALSFEADVRDGGSVDRLFADVEASLGPVDILVNNAGGGSSYRFLNLPREEFERVLRLNVLGSFHCAQNAARSMIEGGRGGVIVNIASVDALGSSAEGLVHYTTSKHAIAGLTRAMAMELGPYGVRVNAVCPGAAWTEG